MPYFNIITGTVIFLCFFFFQVMWTCTYLCFCPDGFYPTPPAFEASAAYIPPPPYSAPLSHQPPHDPGLPSSAAGKYLKASMVKGNFYIALVGMSRSGSFCSCILSFLLLSPCQPLLWTLGALAPLLNLLNNTSGSLHEIMMFRIPAYIYFLDVSIITNEWVDVLFSCFITSS